MFWASDSAPGCFAPFLLDSGDPIPETEEYTLRLENVSYRYPGAEPDTLHDLPLPLHPG